MKNIIITLVIGIGLIIFSQKSSFSYGGSGVGARALGMGGTFVAVADGIDACYWNPAGLGNIKKSEFTIMRTMNNRDITNYQEWVAVGTKLGDYGAIGISYAHFKFIFPGLEKHTWKITPYVSDEEWIVVSFGAYGGEQFKNVALGINMRKKESYLLKKGASFDIKWSDWELTGHKADFIEYDIGILYHVNKELSMGIMIQNFNETIVDYGVDSPIHKFIWRRNIRPGISWRPDEKTIFAIDIYYFDLNEQSQGRIGFERWCSDKIAVRAGFLNRQCYTIGFGLREVELKKLFPHVRYSLDYALVEENGIGTHFLSWTMRF